MNADLDQRSYPGGAASTVTPLRRPGSLRRTTTHDSIRPEGLSGPVVVEASGRDLITTASGESIEHGAAKLSATVQYLEGIISAIATDPPLAGVAMLVGAGAFSGFRKAVETALPEEMESHSVRAQLLDELPAAALQSGRVLREVGIPIEMSGAKLPVDICAGWVAGGTLLAGMADEGPPLQTGPRVPEINVGSDPLAWHKLAPLPAHSTRRCRRLDLWVEGERVFVDSFFRDSHVDALCRETVVHEWTVVAELDPVSRCFTSANVRTGPLPYLECPGAALSVERLKGMPAEGLRRSVRRSFVGPSTCTHLNDTLRSMEDVSALLDDLREFCEVTLQ